MNETKSAWYYHFWPWFIVALLGSAVVGSLATVVVAYRHADVEVPRSSGAQPPVRLGLPDPPTSDAAAEAAADLRDADAGRPTGAEPVAP